MKTQQQTQLPEPARGHDVFVSYSRADRDAVVRLTEGLASKGKRAWVDLEDIPPSAEWMAEIRSAIEAADWYLVVVSPALAGSKVCAEELEHAREASKRIVPVLVRATDPESVPQTLAALNWIDATGPDLDPVLDRIVTALETDLEQTKTHTRLLVRASEWEQRGEDRSLLLRGSDLKEAEGFLVQAQGKEPAPTPVQAQFIQASRHATARRQRAAIAVVTVMFLLAAVLGVVALQQRNAAEGQRLEAISQRDRAEREASVANSRALAAAALSKMDSELDLGVLLGLEAERIAHTPESQQAIRVASQRTNWMERVIRGENGSVTDLAFSPDGRLLASGNDDDAVHLWDPETGAPVGDPLPNEDDVLAVAFSPDGRFLASGDKTGSVIVWDVQTGHRVSPTLERHRGWTYDLSFSPDGSLLASGGTEDSVIVWDTATWDTVGKGIRGTLVAFAPQGRLLATGSKDVVRLWNPRTGEELRRPLQGHSSWVQGIAFSPDGDLLASASSDKTIRLWDPETGTAVGEPLRGHTDVVWRVEFSPDGRTLASGGNDTTVRLWDPMTGQQVGSALEGHRDAVFTLAFSPDGNRLASGSHDGTIVLWDANRGVLRGHTKPVWSATFSPDGRLLASASDDRTIRLWSLATGEEVSPPIDDDEWVGTVAFSPDGNVLASGGGSKIIQLWDVTSGEPVGEPLEGHERAVYSVAFSPDGDLLASASGDRTVRLWDVATGEPVGRPLKGHQEQVYSVAFSPDGELLASASDDSTVRLWDVSTGDPVGEPLRGHLDIVNAVAFSPDGRTLASGSKDGTIAFWDVATRQQIGQPLVQVGWVLSLAFSPDGQFLVSSSHLGTINVWNVETRQLIGEPMKGHSDFVNSVAFNPDGTSLASASSDGTIVLWDSSLWSAPVSDAKPKLCAIAGRNLSRLEADEFVPFLPPHLTCPGE